MALVVMQSLYQSVVAKKKFLLQDGGSRAPLVQLEELRHSAGA